MDKVPDWVWFAGFFAASFALLRWLLPRMGVGT